MLAIDQPDRIVCYWAAQECRVSSTVFLLVERRRTRDVLTE